MTVRRALLRHATATAAVLLVALGLAAQASAGEPTGEYAVFKDCPLATPNLTACVFSETTSGEVVIHGNRTPITKTIVLQGGTIVNSTTGEETWVEAADGNTLSKTPQPVPGGLLGVLAPEDLPLELGKLVNKLVSEGLGGVTATTELVAKPEYHFLNLVNKKGIGVVLPVRIHLSNTFLGSACFIGSASKPITLQLTTGTTSPPPPNTPITGATGVVELRDGGQLVIARGYSIVDNSFSVPVAQGCGGLLALGVDPSVDLKLGLPSPAGENTAILNGTLEEGSAAAVKQSGESAQEREEREAREEKERIEREEKERIEREERERREEEEELAGA
jgi:hypothetical protein